MSAVDYFDRDRRPTPKQYRELAEAACRLLGIEPPASRLDANEATVRLKLADAKREASS